jgi:type IV pilus assembly protein PilE
MKPQMRGAQPGFTLIELIIAMAIFAILAAIAYPSYTQYVIRGNRADATTSLESNAQILERCYSQTYDYTQCTAQLAGTSPKGYYTLAVSNVSQSSFSLTATPVAGLAQAADGDCPSFGLDSKGVQAPSPGTNNCWAGH